VKSPTLPTHPRARFFKSQSQNVEGWAIEIVLHKCHTYTKYLVNSPEYRLTILRYIKKIKIVLDYTLARENYPLVLSSIYWDISFV